MQLLFDFFPILLFFLAFKLSNSISIATFIAILSTLVQLFWYRFKNGKYNKTHIISFFSILILGGATIMLNNELFIKWKPTVVYWILALLFLGSQYLGKKSIMEMLIEKNIKLPQKKYDQLNKIWALFFLFIGSLNLYVVYNFSTNTWVNFKLFGILGITCIFIIIQSIFMARHVKLEQIIKG